MKALAIIGLIHPDCYHVQAIKIGEASSLTEAKSKESKWWNEVHQGKRKKHGVVDTGICNNFEGSEIEDAQNIQLYE